MRSPLCLLTRPSALVGGLILAFPFSSASAQAVKNEATAVKDEAPAVNLLEALRDRSIGVKAEGTGDGRMTLSVTNNTKRPLRVVLPPGLIATSATGQFGGMGGG
ncbi:hypothetical protein ACYOEI_35890, partial [Singulisphaera rosea]